MAALSPSSSPDSSAAFRDTGSPAILCTVDGLMESGAAHRPAQVYRLREEFRRTLSVVPRGLNS
ncbi:hypothetical protein [Paracidovorax citrulli]